jgi:diguanylate cyclase (GGDEF)-like protein
MRILIAEDSDVSQLLLERTLQRWGYEVVSAADGQEAWERFSAEPCSFVITDWMMPRLDGLELCRRIRGEQGHGYTYIIVLTAKNQKADLVEGMDAGADDFVSKPFDGGELRLRIRAGERILALERSLVERTQEIQAINQQLRRSVEREHLINQLLRSLNESLELDAVLEKAVTPLQQLYNASRSFVRLLDQEHQVLRVASEHCAEGVAPMGRHAFFPLEHADGASSQKYNSLRVAQDLERELEKNPRASSAALLHEFGVRALLSVPIIKQERWLGDVGLHQCGEPRRWTGEETSLLYTIAQQMAVVISNAEMHRSVQEQSVRDGLTGLFNRRYFDQTMKQEMERAVRYGHVLSLVMVDLDFLKTINDEYGHQAGDVAIKEIGQILTKHSRRVDIAARYGGEEFAVILPATSTSGAQTAAENWRKAINRRTVAGDRQLSASLGVATYPHHAATLEGLMKAADRALYRAKHEGRNRVCVANEVEREAAGSR